MSQIKLTADSGGGTTSLKAPSSTTSNADVVLKLPVADGSANQVLKTDGSGQLSFTSNAGTTINNNADNRIITGSGTANTLEGEANLTYDGSGITLTGTNPYIDIVDSNNDSDFSIKNDNGTFEINDATNSDATRLAIDSSGNVGIGTTSPARKFVVTEATANRIANFTTGGSSGAFVAFLDSNTTDDSKCRIGSIGGNALGIRGDSHSFQDGAGNTKMHIDSSGNVGIGTSTINYPSGGGLTIYNATAPRLRLLNSSTGTGTHDGAEIAIDNTTKDFYIENREGEDIIFYSGSERLRINDSGGLNHTSGTDNMITSSIAGAIRMQLTHTGGGDVNWANPSSGSAAYSTSSDYRLKQDVVDLPNAWSTVKALKPYEYKWKHNTSKTSQGFFAHEVIATAPNSQAGQGTKDAVDEDDKPIYQQIDYSKLVPVLTKALQEAIGKIETLETKVAALEGA